MGNRVHSLFPVAAWLLVIGLYLGVGVFDHSVWSPTEPAVSGIVWEMFTHGDLAVPRINGFPYFEKPPLFYWCSWLACKIRGALDPGLIRLPSALFGLASLLVLFWVSKRRHGHAIAIVLLLMGAVTFPFFELSHRACTDIAAVFFCFLALGLFVRSLMRNPTEADGLGSGRLHGWDWLFILSMALSFYSKNFYTFLVVCPPVFLFLLMRRRWAKGLFMGALLGGVTVGLALPWVWAVYKSGGMDYLRVVFVDNTIGRFFKIPNLDAIDIGPLNDAYIAEKGKPVYYYLIPFLTMTQPWLLAMLPAIIRLFRKTSHPGDEIRAFLRLALLTIPLVLSLSSSKVAEYLYPLLFILFLILGDYLRDLFQSDSVPKFDRAMWGITGAIMGIALPVASIVLAIVTRKFLLLGWLIPILLLAIFVGKRRCFSGEGGAFFLMKALMVAVGGFAVLLMYVYPYLEERKSYRFFFEEIEPLTEGRSLYSTFCDDRRLPLINFYLDRRVHMVPRGGDPLAPLAQAQAVGVIMPPSVLDENREWIEQKGWTAIPTRRGKNAFVYVANGHR